MPLPRFLQIWRDRLTPRRAAPALPRQAGAIPYRIVGGVTVFLIITSRRTGRWIFPKGGPMEGLTPWESAAQEAFEEAGVEGEIETMPIGSYRDSKAVAVRRIAIDIDLYPLRVQRQLDDWPEKGKRRRHWVALPDARQMLSHPGLVDLAEELERRLASTA